MPRPYRSTEHLQTAIETDVGAIWVWPQEADRIYFDIAQANHLPSNAPATRNGSSVLDIGGGVQIRASGSAYLRDGAWTVPAENLSMSQYPTGRALTAQQATRARELIAEIIEEWAKTHEGYITQAENCYRNNAAQTLEEKIERHKAALTILRRELRKCDNGRDFTQYPDLPTKRR